MANFAGAVYGNIQSFRADVIRYASAGNPFNHATEAGSPGLREPGVMTITPNPVTPDAAKRRFIHAYDVEVNAKLMQSDIEGQFQNIVLLGGALHKLQVLTADGDYYNYVDNLGTVATPAGSRMVGCGYTFTLEQESRSLDVTWKTRISHAMYAWIKTNFGAGYTGGASGGTALGLAANDYDVSKFRVSNIEHITIGGFDVGVIGADFKLELKSDESDETGFSTQHNQTICKMLSSSLEFSLRQTRAAEIQAMLDHHNVDSDIVITTSAGETITYSNGAADFIGQLSAGDGPNMIKFTSQGLVPITAAGVVFGTNALTLDLIGY